ncbi:MAG: mannonate dehydratase [Candidatus Sulfotelmatobacter sp.]
MLETSRWFGPDDPVPLDPIKQAATGIVSALHYHLYRSEPETIRRLIAEYEGVTSAELQANPVAFLRKVVPVAQQTGIRLAAHSDDPPWPPFGLLRVGARQPKM